MSAAVSRPKPMIITAKYASACKTCGKEVRPGDRVEWTRGDKHVSHVQCTATGQKLVAAVEASKASAPKVGGAEVVVPEDLELFPFQAAGVQHALSFEEGILLADEQGLGKTPQTAAYINSRPELRKVLVVCPASLRINWGREMDKWLTERTCFRFELSEDCVVRTVERVDTPVVTQFPDVSGDVVVINYDILNKLAQALPGGKWDLLVLDEVQYAKNPKTARAKHVATLRKASGRVLALTGTPIPNHVVELFPLLQLIAPLAWDPAGRAMRRENGKKVYFQAGPGDGAGFFPFAKRYCCPPDAPIWMADLSFKPLGNIIEGDEIIGWNTPPSNKGRKNKSGNKQRRLALSVVLKIQKRVAKIVKITFNSGREIRCTPDHIWAAAHSSKQFPWTRAIVGHKLARVIDPTPLLLAEFEHTAGWLGGMYDGEGSVGRNGNVRISQSPTHNPEICMRLDEAFQSLRIPFSRGADGDCEHWNINGGKQSIVNFANWCKPVHLKKLKKVVFSARFKIPETIKSIEPAGVSEVVSLTTSTGNYIVYGFASKNCGAYQKQVGVNKDRSPKFAWVWDGASNLDELQEKLRSTCMVRRMKKDVLPELPPKQRSVVCFPGDQALDEITGEREGLPGVVKAKTLDEALQAMSSYKASFEGYSALRKSVAMKKVELVAEHVRNILDGSETEKVIVFAHHHEVVHALNEVLAPYGCVEVTGETPVGSGSEEGSRQWAVDKFQSDSKTRVFIGTILSCGTGITLTAAQRVVFAELPLRPSDLVQAEDRAHRIGQVGSVQVDILVYDGSVDAAVAELLVAKQNVADMALDKDTIPSIEGREAAPKALSYKEAREKAYRDAGLTPEECELLLQKMRAIAGACDGTQVLDGAGFSKFDAPLGHALASCTALSPKQALAARKLAKKYRRQLSSFEVSP